MDPLSITTITFGLRMLKEVGLLGSLVFSPIFLLLAENKPNTVRNKFNYVNGQIEKLEEISKIVFQTKEDAELKTISYTATWRYPYWKSHHQRMRFHTESGKVEHLKFVSANKTLSEELVTNKYGFRIAQDEVFSILKIPLNQKCVRLVIFLPNPEFTLEESMKKLDADRIHSLFKEFTVYNVHYKIPYFEMRSTVDTSNLLGIQNSKFQKFRFHWTKPTEKYTELDDDFNESFIKRPPDRTPFEFVADRPFFFAVFNETLPILMGVFTGTNF